jgi:hypothetical protein
MRRLVLLLALLPASAAADEPAPRPEAKPEDVESIDAILGALYDVISGPKGQARDFDRLRSLFAPGARLIPIVAPREGKPEARVLEVEEFIRIAGPALEEGFFEGEIARTTQRFGHLAHVLSTYEARRAKNDPPFTRGINSIQLLHDGTRWWVVTIYWETETKDRPIPDEFLPK